MTHLTNLDLNYNQILNTLMQKLAAAPTSPTPVEGQVYYNTVSHRAFQYNGTIWVGMDGADATGVAVANIGSTAETVGGSVDNGSAATAARSDHKHAITTPSLEALGATTDVTTLNATTTAHGLLLRATAPAAATLNVVGIANGETVYANKTLFDATNPAALGTAGPGTSLVAAHRDHIHALPALDALASATDNTTGDATTTIHGLLLRATAPAAGLINFVGIANGATAYTNKALFDTTNPVMNGSVAVGTALTAARIDHVHPADTNKQAAGNELSALQSLADTAGFVKKTGDGAYSIDTATYGTSNLAVADLSGTAMTLGGSAVVGVATSASRSDHKHAITNPSIESLGAATDVTTLNATTTAHGLVVRAVAPASTFLNVVGIANGETAYTNKTLFDATTPADIGTAAAGTSVYVARRDHVHAYTGGHTQNTDTGTSSATFMIGTGGPKVKNSSGEVQMRDNADTGYADLRVKDLIVEGTTTTINSNTVNIGDAEILLNADITLSASNSDGGIAVKRLMADNTTPKNALMTFNNSTGKWQTTHGAVTGTLITAQVANKVTAAVGDTAATSFVITHNLNSRDLIVMVRKTATDYAAVIADIEFTTVDTITVKFAVAPSASQYTVTIVG